MSLSVSQPCGASPPESIQLQLPLGSGESTQAFSLRSIGAVILTAALILGALPLPAFAHNNVWVYNYNCGGDWVIEHSTPGSYHRAAGIPFGPETGCELYKAKVTVTSWSGGGGSGWYTHPIHTKERTWTSSWWANFADDNYYCYFVRSVARGRNGSTSYSWKYNYHGGQSQCWEG